MKRSVETKKTTNLLTFYQQREKPSSRVRRRQERRTSNFQSCAVKLSGVILLPVLFRDVRVPVSLSL